MAKLRSFGLIAGLFFSGAVLLVGPAVIGQAPAFGQGSAAVHYPGHSLIAEYVPWGVDEYELFGLTKADIAKSFKDTLGFEEPESRIYFVGYNSPGLGRPGFVVTFADGKIATVKRLFIDGGGCHIVGPVLKSKKEALNFTIAGVSKLTNRSAKDEARLTMLKKKLAEIDGAKSNK